MNNEFLIELECPNFPKYHRKRMAVKQCYVFYMYITPPKQLRVCASPPDMPTPLRATFRYYKDIYDTSTEKFIRIFELQKTEEPHF